VNSLHPTALCALQQRALAPLSDSRSSDPVGGSSFASELAAFNARIEAQANSMSDDFQKLRAANRRIEQLELDNFFRDVEITVFQSATKEAA